MSEVIAQYEVVVESLRVEDDRTFQVRAKTIPRVGDVDAPDASIFFDMEDVEKSPYISELLSITIENRRDPSDS